MELFILSSIAFVGLLVGSFLNVVIYRVPVNESIAFPVSHCPSCSTPLMWWHNIPILSWALLMGKCHFCNISISKQYPIVEFLTGLIFVLVYFRVGLTWELPFIALSFAMLFALSMIDFKYMAVPDSVNFAALGFALIQVDFIQGAIDASLAAGGLYLLGLIMSIVLKKQAMGGADVIVAGTMGAILGFPGFFIAIFLSAVLSILPAALSKDGKIPFVPFLSVSTLIVYIFDSEVTQLLEWTIYK